MFFLTLNRFFKDRLVSVSLLLSLILNFIGWLILSFVFRPQPELIPLHYNIYFGIDFLGPWYWIFILPTLGLLINFINFFLASLLYRKEKIISYFLVVFSSFIQLLLLIVAGSIIFLNKL